MEILLPLGALPVLNHFDGEKVFSLQWVREDTGVIIANLKLQA